ncbi:MAG TPA: FxSxx-COOH cyclophane-containing RiPP peptide [Pseudonocardiaceae bacterium]|jgi:FXSXX-COOH protein|nr:FxSxx-COOH cyclophane-containing RiPP peptide [Pseudonocardiaceae bacterium]
MADEAVFRSELPDLSEVDLDTVEELPESVLRAVLTRILAEHPDPADQYSAFQSSF